MSDKKKVEKGSATIEELNESRRKPLGKHGKGEVLVWKGGIKKIIKRGVQRQTPSNGWKGVIRELKEERSKKLPTSRKKSRPTRTSGR